MSDKMLLLVNPCSGRRRVVPMLPQIVNTFAENGYETRVYLSTHRGEISELAEKYGGEADRVVCAGGDGTLNEMISGLLRGGHDVPIGYIPAGTTNDLARTLGLSTDIQDAARDIVTGSPMPLDVGCMNGRYFMYTASFGAFTRSSYAAAQTLKNTLGHAAYIIEAMRDLSNIKAQRVRAVAGDVEIEGDMLFGSASNSTSLGGILKLDPALVSLNDGKFELMLLEKPRDVGGYAPMLECLINQHYDNEYIHLITCSQATLTMSSDTDWTLDGEFSPGAATVKIENIHSAVRLMVRREDAPISFGF